MSKISKEGYDQIVVIKNALDSMYEKLDSKNFEKVKQEFGGIAKVLANAQNWERV